MASSENGTRRLYNTIKPLIQSEIKEMTKSFCKTSLMVVKDAYDETTGKVGVAEAYGPTIHIPVCGIVDTSKLVVGAVVWVFAPYNSMGNAIVLMYGDGSV